MDILAQISPSENATLQLTDKKSDTSTVLATFVDETGVATKEFPCVQAGLKWLSQLQAKTYQRGNIDDVARSKSILSCTHTHTH